jgi:hypothetical protein
LLPIKGLLLLMKDLLLFREIVLLFAYFLQCCGELAELIKETGGVQNPGLLDGLVINGEHDIPRFLWPISHSSFKKA